MKKELINIRRNKMGMVFQVLPSYLTKTSARNIAFAITVKGISTKDSMDEP